jgi:branched-chain amino acid aminotransferase
VTAWINGDVVPLDDARVSVLDHGLVVGDGVFETLRIYNGQPFAWTRHLARLHASAEAIGLELPPDDELFDAAKTIIAANGLDDGRLRVTITGGIAPPGSGRGDGPVTAFVLAFPLEPAAPTIDVVVVPWTINEHGPLAGLKTISYAGNVRALAYAAERGAGEAIYANTSGNLCEGTGSNVFVVLDGMVCTPPLSSGCLAGVTRALVLELGIAIAERDIPIDTLSRADEAFLCSTTREVQPIAHVDGHALNAPGPIALQLAERFTALVARTLDP